MTRPPRGAVRNQLEDQRDWPTRSTRSKEHSYGASVWRSAITSLDLTCGQLLCPPAPAANSPSLELSFSTLLRLPDRGGVGLPQRADAVAQLASRGGVDGSESKQSGECAQLANGAERGIARPGTEVIAVFSREPAE